MQRHGILSRRYTNQVPYAEANVVISLTVSTEYEIRTRDATGSCRQMLSLFRYWLWGYKIQEKLLYLETTKAFLCVDFPSVRFRIYTLISLSSCYMDTDHQPPCLSYDSCGVHIFRTGDGPFPGHFRAQYRKKALLATRRKPGEDLTCLPRKNQ